MCVPYRLLSEKEQQPLWHCDGVLLFEQERWACAGDVAGGEEIGGPHGVDRDVIDDATMACSSLRHAHLARSPHAQ